VSDESDAIDAKWFEAEKYAMLGHRDEALKVVSALRAYRAAVRKLLASRYGDGECDSYGLSTFADSIAEIDQLFEVEG